jgi:hypothetical protein
MRMFGHRGASADYPENTKAAFDAALENAADGVEWCARHVPAPSALVERWR